MFWNVLKIEATKVFTRPFFRVELALLFLAYLLVVLVVTGGNLASHQEWLTWPLGLTVVFQMVQLYRILLIVLVGVVTAQEFSWRTVQLWLGQGVARRSLLVAKFLICWFATLLMIAFSLLLISGVTALGSLLIRGMLPLNQVDFLQLILSCLRIVYALLPYVALSFFLAMTTRSAVAAVGGGLLFTLVIESLFVNLAPLLTHLSGVGGDIYRTILNCLPATLDRSLLSLNTVNAQASSQGIVGNPVMASAGIAIYIVACAGIALVVFLRQDMNN